MEIAQICCAQNDILFYSQIVRGMNTADGKNCIHETTKKWIILII